MAEAQAPAIPCQPTILMFEFGVGGHYPNYLRMLIQHWLEHGFGHLHIVVTRRMLRHFAASFEDIPDDGSSTVSYVTLDEDEEVLMNACKQYSYGYGEKPQQLARQHDGSISSFFWSLIRKYGTMFPARHMLLMNLDECLIALSAGERAPVEFSGIFFRPGFQYRDAANASRLDAFSAIQEKMVLDRLLKHPQLRAAFFLDRTVSDRFAGYGPVEAVHLPDPVRLPQKLPSMADQASAKSDFGVPAERRVFLLFGDIAPRKGVAKLLEALKRLSPEEQRKICLAVVGNSAATFENRIAPHWAAFSRDTEVQFIRRRDYIDDAEIQKWFAAASVVLAPYLRHVGMSGVQLLAAAYGKPVLSQDFGVMGQMTRDHGLGVAANPVNVDELAEGLRAFLGPEMPAGWKPEGAAALARQHSHEKFGETLFGTLRRFIE